MALKSTIENLLLSQRLIEKQLKHLPARARMESGVLTDMKSGTLPGQVVSSSENLMDAAGNEEHKVAIGDSAYPATGQTNVITLREFMSRPVRLTTTTLALSSDLLLKYDVWDLFSQDPSVRAKLRNFAYLQADMKVVIDVSGSPFHKGRLLVSYQPYANYNDNLISLETERTIYSNLHVALNGYLSQARGAVVVDVKDNMPLELTIPFICPNPMFRLFDSTGSIAAASAYPDLAEAGTLYITTLNQIGSASASPSDVQMTIYGTLENVKLGTLTSSRTEVTTESGPVGKEAKDASSVDEREAGPVEKFTSSAMKITSLLQGFPPIAPFAKASYMASSALNTLSAHFGWSRPVVEGPSQYVKNMGFRNGANVIGCETTYKLTLDPKQELTVDPRIVGTSEDEMTMSFIAAKESYFTSFDWAPTDLSTGGEIFACFVNPCVDTVIDTVAYTMHQPTALSFAATPFEYWRGDITYRMEVVCSTYHRGKLYVSFEPNSGAYALLASNVSLNKKYAFVWDIQETQSIEFCVPWAQHTAWLETKPGNVVYAPADTATAVSTSGSNGFFTIVPFTSLQSPDDSAVAINVYVKSDDLHLNFVTAANNPEDRPSLESGEFTPRNPSSLANVDVTCVELNASSANTDSISDHFFGEEPRSFRALLKRYQPYNDTAYAAPAASSVVNRLQYIGLRAIPDDLPYGTTGAIKRNLFSYLRYAYLGYRGSTRRRLTFPGLTQNFASSAVKVLNAGPATSATQSATVAVAVTRMFETNFMGTATFLTNSNAGIEFELPFYYNSLFWFSFTTNPTAAGCMSNSVSRAYFVKMDITSTIASFMYEDIASGEDFSFLRFTGAPLYTT